jgi:uncharacterized protein DUF6886
VSLGSRWRTTRAPHSSGPRGTRVKSRSGVSLLANASGFGSGTSVLSSARATLAGVEPAPPWDGEGAFALWHFSEDASLSRFRPRASAAGSGDRALVWAVDTRHAPMFWFRHASAGIELRMTRPTGIPADQRGVGAQGSFCGPSEGASAETYPRSAPRRLGQSLTLTFATPGASQPLGTSP